MARPRPEAPPVTTADAPEISMSAPQQLDDRGVGLAAALAHRLQAVAEPVRPHAVHERGHEAGAGSTQRVAERDGAAVPVQQGGVGPGLWRQALDRGVAAGALRPAPPLLVKGILGMLNYTYLWFEPDGELSPEELADEYVDLLLRGIRVSP